MLFIVRIKLLLLEKVTCWNNYIYILTISNQAKLDIVFLVTILKIEYLILLLIMFYI